MPIFFPCTDCCHALNAPEKAIGSTVACPTCRCAVAVPTLIRTARTARPPASQPPAEKRATPSATSFQKGRRRMLIGAGVASLLLIAVALVVIVRQPAKGHRVETPNVAAGGEPRNVSDNTAKSKASIEPVGGPAGGAPVVRPTPTGKTSPSVNPDGGIVRPSQVGDETRLQGEWVCTHEESGGNAISASEMEKMGKILTMAGDKLVIERSKEVGRGKYDGTVKLAPTTSPKQFDFYGDKPGGGKAWFFGVYELTDDEFKICYFWATTPEDRGKRPADFKTRPGVPLVMNKFKRVAAPSPGNPVVAVKTSLGDFKIELYEDKAPNIVGHFLSYVRDEWFDGTIFHVAIRGCDIQAGYTGQSKKAPGRLSKVDTNDLKNEPGTVNLGNEWGHFYINVGNNAGWRKECVIGRVIEGMDVVKKISEVETTKVGGNTAMPVKPVTIISIRREPGGR